MKYLPLVMCWVWACLVFAPRHPLTAFFLFPVVIPVGMALVLLPRALDRAYDMLIGFNRYVTFVEQCIGGDK